MYTMHYILNTKAHCTISVELGSGTASDIMCVCVYVIVWSFHQQILPPKWCGTTGGSIQSEQTSEIENFDIVCIHTKDCVCDSMCFLKNVYI